MGSENLHADKVQARKNSQNQGNACLRAHIWLKQLPQSFHWSFTTGPVWPTNSHKVCQACLKTNYADDGIMRFGLDPKIYHFFIFFVHDQHLPFCPWTCSCFHPFYPSTSNIIMFVTFSTRPAFVFLSSALFLFFRSFHSFYFSLSIKEVTHLSRWKFLPHGLFFFEKEEENFFVANSHLFVTNLSHK